MNKHPLFLLLLIIQFVLSGVFAQETESIVKEYTSLKKRVFNYTKIDFITSEGEFNESICTLAIPELKEDSPPYVAIYYKRDQSVWFTESLYRKRLRFSFKDGILKLDRSNFWDWFELAEIKIVVIY
ncbi:MAG: hypothetical protein ISR83_03295 [Candidatus Marinimicrobia bacterium]|nr:hypothetical protein [Candidatus Neomarinimicrobiota bacterium]